jgi:hypothetical protein
MTKSQFLIQTIIQIATVAATLLLGVIAIWGDFIKAKLLGPKLRLSLFDSEGERINLTDGTNARYYHLRVTNARRSAQAKNVRVVVIKIVRPAADGSIPEETLSGPVQLIWQHGHSMPQYPTVGPSLNCDLGCLLKDGGFNLSLQFVPNNVDPNVLANQKMQVQAIAVSDETESNPLTVEIAWDGTWTEVAKEMRKHMVVKEINT